MTHSLIEQTAKAKRVRSLRKLTDLSRQDFEKRFGIPSATLQHWEDPKKNGLTEKGAKRLIQVLKQVDIYCTTEWLLQGKGAGPQRLPQANEGLILAEQSHFQVKENDDLQFIAEELALFNHHYSEVINTIVPDDSMEPRFIEGEYVAGIRYYKQDMTHLIGEDCIVVTTEGELLVRRIKSSEIPDSYTLISSNVNTTIDRPILYNVQLVSAAPIIWSRRPKKF